VVFGNIYQQKCTINRQLSPPFNHHPPSSRVLEVEIPSLAELYLSTTRRFFKPVPAVDGAKEVESAQALRQQIAFLQMQGRNLVDSIEDIY
jgi:hypothetical protein